MLTIKLETQPVHQVKILGTTADFTLLCKALGELDTYNLRRMHLSASEIESIQGLHTALANIIAVV